ncbi:conserved Plasmodium protein, unknown function [Plasmodium sp. gorilla clade G2]|uniref:conserved Plasmodium protein, unknown function n=1 Tax=Plasmodium sp. gorilla clade G2 TaxID=880535 RepID=UPI000D20D09A|nr:conserved Plasmodium protein, unknown function [Plasmodium sp. gorilla clade G2]SOV11564.1 conserved Plasmodium protein, unknown function [Plasmodium sp. gorilla clade G2]
MKLFTSLICSFVLFFYKLSICEKLDSLNNFYFKDVKRIKNDMSSKSNALYPLIHDLEEDNQTYSNDENIYDENSFPNPFTHPEECVLSLGISHTWLCDPSAFLSIEQQLDIEAELLKIRDTNFHKCSNNSTYYYQVSVAIVPEIFVSKNNTYENAAQEFSEQLLRKWGIGHSPCHDGILLVYIKNLGKFVIAKREGVEEKYINENEIKKHFMNTYFASGSISRALIESLSFINKKLPSKPTELTNTAKMFLILILFYIVSIIILYVTTLMYSKSL